MNHQRPMPVALIVCALLAGSAARAGESAHGNPAGAPAGGIALVELFTSEGCSSCPPADALLERLVREAEGSGRRVYGLSMHVDYWDRLGWRDRFSSSVYTKRQSEYARRFDLQSLYTPQMVVNGAREFVGSNSNAARVAIDEALARPSEVTPGLSVTEAGDDVRAHITVAHAPRGARLNVAWVQSRAVSSPDRGENGGRTLRHANVVRGLQTVELSADFDGEIRLQRPGGEDGEVIAWVQEAGAGRVLGATARSVRAHGPGRKAASRAGHR